MRSACKARLLERRYNTDELIAASDAVGGLDYLQCLLLEPTYPNKSATFVDSRTLFNLATSLLRTDDFGNWMGLASLAESINLQIISTFRRIPGYNNLADAMNKDNRTTGALVLRELHHRVYPPHSESLSKHTVSTLDNTDLSRTLKNECKNAQTPAYRVGGARDSHKVEIWDTTTAQACPKSHELETQ